MCDRLGRAIVLVWAWVWAWVWALADERGSSLRGGWVFGCAIVWALTWVLVLALVSALADERGSSLRFSWVAVGHSGNVGIIKKFNAIQPRSPSTSFHAVVGPRLQQRRILFHHHLRLPTAKPVWNDQKCRNASHPVG